MLNEDDLIATDSKCCFSCPTEQRLEGLSASYHLLLWKLGRPSKIRPTVSSRQNIPAV